jgi:hypothetical protein
VVINARFLPTRIRTNDVTDQAIVQAKLEEGYATKLREEFDLENEEDYSLLEWMLSDVKADDNDDGDSSSSDNADSE